MTDADHPSAASTEGARPIRDLFRRDGRSMLAAAVVTLAIILGLYFSGRSAGVGPPHATVAALAAGTLWLALACPILAAGGRGALSALARGGIVADAGAVALLVLWAARRFAGPRGPCLTFRGAVQIYCTFVAVALVQVAAARCPRSRAWRYVAGVAAAVVMTALLATPFWVSGPVSVAGPHKNTVVAAAVYLNPFYSVTSAVVEQTRFIWHESGAMYEMSRLFDYAPPPVRWYTAAVIYGLLAAILAATHLVRTKKIRTID